MGVRDHYFPLVQRGRATTLQQHLTTDDVLFVGVRDHYFPLLQRGRATTLQQHTNNR